MKNTTVRDNIVHERFETAAELGAVIRRFRKAQGLTQIEAAALAGVGARFLSELERGKETAELGLVLKVLQRFGLTPHVEQRGKRDRSWKHA